MTGIADTLPVTDRHRFDESSLDQFLRRELAGYCGNLDVRQFHGGHSNPTFLLMADMSSGARGSFVLRKRPPGILLPSAHQVDREYRAMTALQGSGVPVPRTRLLCRDASIIGQEFFVMDYMEGRIFTDPSMPGVPCEQRARIFDSMNDTLARLHRVDVDAVGLGDFGKKSGFVARQVDRFSRQFLAAKTGEIPEMDALMEWLPRHIPPEEPATIAHGDFRLGNLIVHPTEPCVIAVLDWELSTLGDPLADLAYNCLCYYLTAPPHGLGGNDPVSLGVPTEAEYVSAYCKRVHRSHIDSWHFYVGFSLFRLASIAQGVYKRELDGIGLMTSGERRTSAQELAEIAWRVVNQPRAFAGL